MENIENLFNYNLQKNNISTNNSKSSSNLNNSNNFNKKIFKEKTDKMEIEKTTKESIINDFNKKLKIETNNTTNTGNKSGFNFENGTINKKSLLQDEKKITNEIRTKTYELQHTHNNDSCCKLNKEIKDLNDKKKKVLYLEATTYN